MGGAVFPSCCLTWGQTMVEVMKIMATSFQGPMHTLLHSVPPTLQQATADPCLCCRLLDTHGQVWVRLLWVTAPFSWVLVCTRFCLCPPRVCVSSGGSMVGIMATSFKRAYVIPRFAAPRAPAPAAGHCWPIPLQETLKHSSGSVCVGVSGSWYAQGLFEPSEHLWWLWGLILNMILPLLPSWWGFSFALGCGVSFFSRIQHSPVNRCSAVSCNFGVLVGEDEHMSFYSTILKLEQHSVVDVTGNGSKVQCCKEQYCIGTWNVRSTNQGKLEVVKQEMARVYIDILLISELK